jgi:hypothetical protein
MTTVARLTSDGDLLLSGEVNERLPYVKSGLIAHYPFDGDAQKYYPSNIRYIRDWVYGSSANTENNWVELKAIDVNGINVALNKPVIGSGTESATFIWSRLTDGIIDSNTYAEVIGAGMPQYLQVDLGGMFSISQIQVWHYYGDGRTYHGTKTEVSQDGINWYEIFDSEIEGEYAETPSGKTFNLQGLGNTVKPLLNTNTTITKDGIAIEEATTNLITTPDFSGGVSFLYPESFEIMDVVNDYLAYKNKAYHLKYISTGTINILNGIVLDYTKPISNNGSFSVYAKGIGNSIGKSLRLYTGNSWYVLEGTLEGTYKRFHINNAVWGVNDSPYFRLQINDASFGDEFWVHSPQVEEKPFATSFADRSRSAGRIDIPFTLKPPYTINLFHKSCKPLSLVVDQGSSPMIFQLNGYYSNASISFWNYVKNLTIYIKGNTATGWTSTGGFYSFTGANWDNVEHMYTLVAVDNRTFKIYVDGIYKGQEVSTEDVTNITYMSMGNSSMPDATYHDLSLYNRGLSDIEISNLFSGKISIDSSGCLYLKNIKEDQTSLGTTKIRVSNNSMMIEGGFKECVVIS